MKICMQIYENIWKIYGEYMENLWTIYETYMTHLRAYMNKIKTNKKEIQFKRYQIFQDYLKNKDFNQIYLRNDPFWQLFHRNCRKNAPNGRNKNNNTKTNFSIILKLFF